MVSTGTGCGVIHTTRDYSHYRLIFVMRNVSGNPDHQACALIFCTRPNPEKHPLDALGGVQFRAPNGGHLDYRPGTNSAGGPEFTSVTTTHFDTHEWSCRQGHRARGCRSSTRGGQSGPDCMADAQRRLVR
jgi:hypothetical protein